jgi:hypothetical protein
MDLKLLQEFFQLEYSFYTTPHVIGEIMFDDQISELEYYIYGEALQIDSNGTFESIQELYDNYPGLSFADSSVLELSARINGILLSSDKSLRIISKKHNIDVRGVLWIIEELVKKKIISPQIAITKLEEYHKFNVRIPAKEIQLIIDKFKMSH